MSSLKDPVVIEPPNFDMKAAWGVCVRNLRTGKLHHHHYSNVELASTVPQ